MSSVVKQQDRTGVICSKNKFGFKNINQAKSLTNRWPQRLKKKKLKDYQLCHRDSHECVFIVSLTNIKPLVAEEKNQVIRELKRETESIIT